MAKNRVSFANIVKGKATEAGKKPNYVYVFRDMTLKKGDYVQLETKQMRLDSLAAALSAGKLSEESAEKARADIEKMEDYNVAELVVYREREVPVV